MGCSSCGTKDGKPGGCKSNGGCSSGGCNRLNVHDWLANLPFTDPAVSCRIVEVTFSNGSRKEYFKNTTLHHFNKGELVSVEGVGGFDVGMVNLSGELVRMQLKKKRIAEDSAELKKILRRATEVDIQKWEENKAREKEALARSRAIARQLKLSMKICEVEFQADGRKATFFYTAEDRVDFRELIKIYAGDFKVKVEMKQIGARQEAAKVGGIGSCGRELCCSSWLNEFKSVTTAMARYQNLSINQTKLSGQCGRLKCCLNYELDSYLDALQHFPDHAEVLHTTKGNANLIKKDIFKNIMWYTLPDSNKQYPLTIDTVKKIKAMNEKGQRPDELETAEIVSASGKAKEAEPQFVELVGQISLRSLDRNAQKRKGQRSGPGPNRERGQSNNPNQGPRDRSQSNNPNQGPRERPKMQEKTAGSQGPRPQAQAGGRPQRERPQGQTRPQAPREKANPQAPDAPRTKPSIQINKEK
ncbi:MAG: regulatory iron-sulfur-containing complex subunit RicT [bacterium]|jgi:cell fate regulator YaaT (PSP1 superfamily)